jgi:hypothetical protein
MKSFSFRQRAGDLNWKKVSEIDITNAIEIDELQSILDSVTFSEINEKDLKKTPVETSTKLIKLMQLSIEYLLFCQESQFNAVENFHSLSKKQRQKIKYIEKDNASLKEDIKVYRRQLSLMQKSILNHNSLSKNPTEILEPKVVLKRTDFEYEGNNADNLSISVQPIMDSVLKHERETQNFLKDIIDNQRLTFLKELHEFVEVKNEQSIHMRKEAEEVLRSHTNDIMNVATSAIQNSANLFNQHRTIIEETILKVQNNDNSYHINQKLNEFMQREEALILKGEKLTEEISLRDEFIERLQKEINEQNILLNNNNVHKISTATSITSLSSKKSEAIAPNYIMISIKTAFCIIKYQFKIRSLFLKFRSCFHIWKCIMLIDRSINLTLQLESVDQNAHETEAELLRKISEEKKKTLVEMARYKTLSRKIEHEKQLAVQVEQQHSRNNEGNNTNESREQINYKILYENLQYEKEEQKQLLEEKIQILQLENDLISKKIYTKR